MKKFTFFWRHAERKPKIKITWEKKHTQFQIEWKTNIAEVRVGLLIVFFLFYYYSFSFSFTLLCFSSYAFCRSRNGINFPWDGFYRLEYHIICNECVLQSRSRHIRAYTCWRCAVPFFSSSFFFLKILFIYRSLENIVGRHWDPIGYESNFPWDLSCYLTTCSPNCCLSWDIFI